VLAQGNATWPANRESVGSHSAQCAALIAPYAICYVADRYAGSPHGTKSAVWNGTPQYEMRRYEMRQYLTLQYKTPQYKNAPKCFRIRGVVLLLHRQSGLAVRCQSDYANWLLCRVLAMLWSTNCNLLAELLNQTKW
jgi:hypothetical protein